MKIYNKRKKEKKIAVAMKNESERKVKALKHFMYLACKYIKKVTKKAKKNLVFFFEKKRKKEKIYL